MDSSADVEAPADHVNSLAIHVFHNALKNVNHRFFHAKAKVVYLPATNIDHERFVVCEEELENFYLSCDFVTIIRAITKANILVIRLGPDLFTICNGKVPYINKTPSQFIVVV